jgi:hypothetical protein
MISFEVFVFPVAQHVSSGMFYRNAEISDECGGASANV